MFCPVHSNGTVGGKFEMCHKGNTLNISSTREQSHVRVDGFVVGLLILITTAYPRQTE